MNSEKIAFLYSFAQGQDGIKIPVVQYDVEKLPVSMSVTLRVAMVGLLQGQDYQMSIVLLSPDSEALDNGSDEVSFKASDAREVSDRMALSIDAKFDGINIESAGNYSARVILKKDKHELDSQICYFTMRKLHTSH